MKQSGELDVVTLEMTLEFLGVKQEHAPPPNPLNEAAQLRLERKFFEAAQILQALLIKNPADTGAALMLMRVYSQDLRQPQLAWKILSELEKQTHVRPDHLEFARRSLVEWWRPKPKTIAESRIPGSLEEMLEKGYWGSAIECLEQKIIEQPRDFGLRLKLAEIHARNCGNFSRAEKIIRQMAAENFFVPEQILMAEDRLKDWREAQSQRK